MAKQGISKVFVWILLAMLIVGLIGFGSTNLGGHIQSIGTVGTKEVSVNSYARALQNRIRALEAEIGQSVTFVQAQLFGIDQQVLSQVVTSRLLDAEIDRVGISVGDELIREQLLTVSSFQGLDGNFDRQTYQLVLENAGLSEAEYEEQLRDELASSILQTSLLTGLTVNPTYAEVLAAYLTETRDVSWAELTREQLDTGIPTPTESDLTAYYEANIDAYTRPETRQITYAWLTPDMLIDSVELDEQSLRDAYDQRAAFFNTPERRLVERLVFQDTASAQDALNRINAGEVSFEDVVAERGLDLINIDLGDVTQSDLGAAGADVFAADNLQVVGPLESSLGPALFRVNGVLAAQFTSYEDALPALRDELAYDRATRVIDAQITDLEDLLAAGATIEELVADTDMQLGQIAWHDEVSDAIAGYGAFRAAAAIATPSDFPEIASLDDGGVFAMRLDAIDAAQPEPFETVELQVIADWTQAQIQSALQDQAEALAEQIATGTPMEMLGLTVTQDQGLGRRGRFEGIPIPVSTTALEIAAIGDTVTAESVKGVYIIRLDAIHAGDMTGEDAQPILDALTQRYDEDISQDVFAAFADAIRLRTDIEIDQTALNAVHANFQ